MSGLAFEFATPAASSSIHSATSGHSLRHSHIPNVGRSLQQHLVEPPQNRARHTTDRYVETGWAVAAVSCCGALSLLACTERQRTRWAIAFGGTGADGVQRLSKKARRQAPRLVQCNVLGSDSDSSSPPSSSSASPTTLADGPLDDTEQHSGTTVENMPAWQKMMPAWSNMIPLATAEADALPQSSSNRRRRQSFWVAPWDVDDSTRNQDMLNETLGRVVKPTILAALLAGVCYIPVAQLCLEVLDIGTTGEGPILTLLAMDQSQFMQNFLTVVGLLFTILVGNTYTSLYNQQERLYHALYLEVSDAKSLLEQVCLLCQGRSFYQQVMQNIDDYVSKDLRQLDAEPSELLAGRPMDDPLESILYVTSVGVPSIIYDTVRDLRQARSQRLGAMQRKLPAVHFQLLYVLGLLVLVSFPLLGAGTASMFKEKEGVLIVQAVLFGAMAGAIVMTLQVCYELWQPFGGAYTVDSVLRRMVRGLENELKARRNAGGFYSPAVMGGMADAAKILDNPMSPR